MGKPKAKYVGSWYISDKNCQSYKSGIWTKAELTKMVKSGLRAALAPGQEGYWEVAVELGPEHYGYLANGFIRKK